MSLAQEKNSEPYLGKGANGVYSIPFRYDDASWLRVTLVNADGTTAKVLPGQYSLSPTGGPQGTATLTTSVAALNTTKLIISRRAPATQLLSLTSNSPLPAKDLEKTLDQMAMAMIDRNSPGDEAVSKSLSFPIGEPAGNSTRLPMPERRKGLFVGFNDTTGEMEARPLSVALHNTINEAKTAIDQTLGAITQGVTTINNAKSAALTVIETARTTTLTVLNNALAVGTDLLARIPLFFKTGESGAIKLGEVNGHEAGSNAINLQSHRTDEWQVASGYRAITIGCSEAFGQDAITIGNESSAGYCSTAIGLGNQATFEAGVAFGYQNAVFGNRSVAIGNNNSAQAYQSTAVGGSNDVPGQLAAAYGYGNSAGGNESLAIGSLNTTYTDGDVAVGRSNTASGPRAVACGFSNSSTGDESSTFGVYNHANGYQATAIGRYNSVTQGGSGAFGHYNYVHAGGSFAFGYGVNLGTSGITELANFSNSLGARVRADSSTGTVGLSFGYLVSAPTFAWDTYPGSEPSGTLGNRMLSFRSDGYNLHIDVGVHDTIKTVTLPLS